MYSVFIKSCVCVCVYRVYDNFENVVTGFYHGQRIDGEGFARI